MINVPLSGQFHTPSSSDFADSRVSATACPLLPFETTGGRKHCEDLSPSGFLVRMGGRLMLCPVDSPRLSFTSVGEAENRGQIIRWGWHLEDR